jgi:large subunit ribosomal protein L18
VSIAKKIRYRERRRALRVRKKFTSGKPRVTIFRSLNHIYAQIIDDSQSKTLTDASSLQLKTAAGDKKAVARAVGLELARKAAEQGLKVVVFDRGSFLYHGRVKALADGLREGGLEF